MKMRLLILTTLFAFSLTTAHALQFPDGEADVSVVDPAFARDNGPVVVIDGAHYNIHTVDGGYAPFANVLRNDGFRVSGSTELFSADMLKPVGILVISNALSEKNSMDWSTPVYSAFTDAEIGAVRSWVENGGSLLLIADHFPVAGAASNLAATFGFTMHNGYARGKPDIFTLADGSLKDDVILRGRKASEAVRKLVTFGGSAFEAPRTARPIIVLPKGFQVAYPETVPPWPLPPSTPQRDAAGLLQGAIMDVAKGRVALFGEAAMFTAQRVNGVRAIGFNAPEASENKQFVLNLLRWLGRATVP
jgi:hypothetical protein